MLCSCVRVRVRVCVQAGTMNVAILNLLSSPVNITVTLTRDGCASLICAAPYASRCQNGACQCNRFRYQNPSGVQAEVGPFLLCACPSWCFRFPPLWSLGQHAT
jgi:hypothetical protein